MQDGNERRPDHDIIVVGAGIGGLYGVYRFAERGMDVLGIEAAHGVGGVWRHNGYPGARVDVESIDYCYYFSPDLYRTWRWKERYAGQPELLAYLDHVADRFDIRRRFVFGHRVVAATWIPESNVYRIETNRGMKRTCRFLVMATGQLSAPRALSFSGLDVFKGESVTTSAWPERPVAIDGKRVAVIGTGSSGVQVCTAVADRASHLFVVQRSPNYSVPARNGPMDEARWRDIADDIEGERERLIYELPGTHARFGSAPMASYTIEDRTALLDAAWETGGHGLSYVFNDQGIDRATNGVVADFVRRKIEAIVPAADAPALCAFNHPIGTRRLVVDTGYYEIFGRDNVELVDVSTNGIRRIVADGIELDDGRILTVDLIVFALGFTAFSGSLDAANIRNEKGEQPSDGWKNGPQTLFGLATHGFPNLFFPTGPGSPSVLGNFFIQNELLMDWIGACVVWMKREGHERIEARYETEVAWTAHCADLSAGLLRRQIKNYMVHVAPDGQRVFIPYTGGTNIYARRLREEADDGYPSFDFEAGSASRTIAT